MHVPRKKNMPEQKKENNAENDKDWRRESNHNDPFHKRKELHSKKSRYVLVHGTKEKILYIDSTTSKRKKLTVNVNNIIEIDSTIIKGKKLMVTKRRKRVPEKNTLKRLKNNKRQ